MPSGTDTGAQINLRGRKGTWSHPVLTSDDCGHDARVFRLFRLFRAFAKGQGTVDFGARSQRTVPFSPSFQTDNVTVPFFCPRAVNIRSTS